MNIDQAYSYIKRSADAKRLAQAYVVVAPPRGVGDTLAQRVLTLLFCTGENVPCGTCYGCVSVSDRTHPDVHWIEPQKKSRIIAIKQIRDIQKEIYSTSFCGGWKACVIVGADCMGNEAANAFLKTLEEPPKQTFYLLLTDSPQRLLPTIISRCQRMTVTGSDGDGLDATLRASVTAILADSSGVFGIGRMAKGDRLVTLLKTVHSAIESEEKEALPDEHTEVDDDTFDGRVSSRYREMRQAIMRSILLWYRDILILSCEADPALVHHRASLDVLQALASRIAYREAVSQVRVVEKMDRQLSMNMPEGLVFSGGFSSVSQGCGAGLK